MRRLCLLTLALALLLCGVTYAAEITGRVVSIADGDTITILDSGKRAAQSPAGGDRRSREGAAVWFPVESQSVYTGLRARGKSSVHQARPIRAHCGQGISRQSGRLPRTDQGRNGLALQEVRAGAVSWGSGLIRSSRGDSQE